MLVKERTGAAASPHPEGDMTASELTTSATFTPSFDRLVESSGAAEGERLFCWGFAGARGCRAERKISVHRHR